jgi:hypothetical protein
LILNNIINYFRFKATRMPPKLSPIWRYFEEDTKDPSTAICKVVGCKKPQVSRGKSGSSRCNLSNSSMTAHLASHHPSKSKEFLESKEKVASDKRKREDNSDDNEVELSTVPVFNIRGQAERQKFLHQATIGNWVSGGGAPLGQSSSTTYDIHDQRAKERHKGILMMVIMDLQPWSFVNDPGFVYCAYQLDPHYKIASSSFYRSLLGKAYEKSVKKVEEKIATDNPEFVACQLDGWSSYRHGYMGMLIGYLTKGWKRVSLCLSCSPFDGHHTGENIADWLDTKLTSWKVLDKTTVVISDTASNMIKSMEFLPNNMEHCGCLNHIMQLTINDEVFQKPEIKNIMAKVKVFINYNSVSVLLSAALEKKQRELGWEKTKQPVKDVKTRWNTTHDTLKRFVELKEPINKVLDEAEWKEKIKYKEKPVKFSGHEWKMMENVVQVLEPFKEATLELSKASASISQTIPTITSLLLTLKPSNSDADSGVKDLKRRLKENLESRTEGYEERDIYSLAVLLDPKYKEHFFRSDERKTDAKEKMIRLLEAEVFLDTINDEPEVVEVTTETNNNLTGLAAAFQALKKKARENDNSVLRRETARDVVENYLSSSLEENKSLTWWCQFEERSKDDKIRLALCKLARKFLTPSPTSTNCERLFSIAGQIMDEKRTNLLPENLERILFLRENMLVTNFRLDW